MMWRTQADRHLEINEMQIIILSKISKYFTIKAFDTWKCLGIQKSGYPNNPKFRDAIPKVYVSRFLSKITFVSCTTIWLCSGEKKKPYFVWNHRKRRTYIYFILEGSKFVSKMISVSCTTIWLYRGEKTKPYLYLNETTHC